MVNDFNNKVTYHDKWNTPENEMYLKKIQKMLKGKHPCSLGVPVSWAKETYELLVKLDKEYGIAYNVHNPETFNPKRMLHSWFIAPINTLLSEPTRHWSFEPLDPISKILSRFRSAYSNWTRYNSKLWLSVKQAVYNRIRKPTLHISQIKEKFGTLRFSCSSAKAGFHDDYIEGLVEKLELDLAAKGAYFPLEDLYDWKSSRWDKSNSISTKPIEYDGNSYTEVNEYSYRKHLRERLGEEKFKELAERKTEEKEENLDRQEEAVKKCVMSVIDAEWRKANNKKFFSSEAERQEHHEYCELLSSYIREKN